MEVRMPKSESSGGKGRLVIIVIASVVGGIMLLGCLAAIAIPAFLKYIERSKASEAPTVASGIAQQVQAQYEQGCEWPQAVPQHADLSSCCGGAKCMPVPSKAEQWEAAGVRPPTDPTYFVYAGRRVDASTYAVDAYADFTCGGQKHTVTVEISAQKTTSGCSTTVGEPITVNEFE
jgi:type II secretory pathway pseudopilin PulG